jgi:hypothetical protein
MLIVPQKWRKTSTMKHTEEQKASAHHGKFKTCASVGKTGFNAFLTLTKKSDKVN